MDIERPVYYKTRQGFIAPMNLLIKIIPSISECVELMGILTEIRSEGSDSAVMLVNGVTGTILGVSQDCFLRYGLAPCLCDGSRSVASRLHINDLFKKMTLRELQTKSVGKSSWSIDTAFLQELLVDSKDLPRVPGFDRRRTFHPQMVKLEARDEQNYGDPDMSVIEVRLREHIDVDALKLLDSRSAIRRREKSTAQKKVETNNEEEEDQQSEVEKEERNEDEENNEMEMKMRMADKERKLKAVRKAFESRRIPKALQGVTFIIRFVSSMLFFVGFFMIYTQKRYSESMQDHLNDLYHSYRVKDSMAKASYYFTKSFLTAK